MSKSVTMRERMLIAAAERFRRERISMPVARRLEIVRAAQSQLQQLRGHRDKGARLRRMKLLAIVDKAKGG